VLEDELGLDAIVQWEEGLGVEDELDAREVFQVQLD
jgi:hypothetical protein